MYFQQMLFHFFHFSHEVYMCLLLEVAFACTVFKTMKNTCLSSLFSYISV